MDYLTTVFALIGFSATLAWLYSSFSSLIWITYYSVLGQIYPQKYSLDQRFGQWAGKSMLGMQVRLPIEDFSFLLWAFFKVLFS